MGALETNITYNGIQLVNVLTESIDQQVVKEPTGVDPLYVQVKISCTCIYHYGDNQAVVHGRDAKADGANLATGYNAIIAWLLQVRRPFVMTVGGNTLFNVTAGMTRPGIAVKNLPLGQTDVNHGPVTTVSVLDIISNRTMKLRFGITMCLPYCASPGKSPGGIISFRFWIAEDIDCTDWTTERVYHGRLRVAHMGRNVHQEVRRNFRFPILQRGFMRRKITLNQSPDGLELEFTIADKEMWAVAPSPATEWSGHHSITSPEPGGSVLHSEIYVRLKAPINVPKRRLIQLAQKIMTAKLHYEDLKNFDQNWLQFASYKESLHTNEVEAHAVVKLVGKDADIKLWNVADLNNTFGLTLDEGSVRIAGYDHTKSFIGAQTATIKGLFLSALNDQCHISFFPNDNRQQSTKPHIIGNDKTEIVDQGTSLQKKKTKYSEDHRVGAYNVYQIASDVQSDLGKIQMPVGLRKKSTDPTSVIISLHGGITTRTIRIEAERLGKWPTVPAPVDFVATASKIQHTLLTDKIYPSAPQLSADGEKTLYHLVYELKFGLSRRPDYSKSEIPAALLPYRIDATGKDGESVFVVPASAFKPAAGLLTTGEEKT